MAYFLDQFQDLNDDKFMANIRDFQTTAALAAASIPPSDGGDNEGEGF